MSDDANQDWKLKLRYGRMHTPYTHFTVLAEGVVGQVYETAPDVHASSSLASAVHSS